jgi:hypothetical protein
MTLINTRNRSTYEGQRKPFNLASLYESEAFKAIQASSTGIAPENGAEPRPVDFGVGVIPGLYLRKAWADTEEQGESPYDGKLEFPTT